MPPRILAWTAGRKELPSSDLEQAVKRAALGKNKVLSSRYAEFEMSGTSKKRN